MCSHWRKKCQNLNSYCHWVMGLWALLCPCWYTYQLPYFLMSMNYFVNKKRRKKKKRVMHSRTNKRVDKINYFSIFSTKLQTQSGIFKWRSMVNNFYLSLINRSSYQTGKVLVKIFYCVLCPNVHLIPNSYLRITTR